MVYQSPCLYQRVPAPLPHLPLLEYFQLCHTHTQPPSRVSSPSVVHTLLLIRVLAARPRRALSPQSPGICVNWLAIAAPRRILNLHHHHPHLGGGLCVHDRRTQRILYQTSRRRSVAQAQNIFFYLLQSVSLLLPLLLLPLLPPPLLPPPPPSPSLPLPFFRPLLLHSQQTPEPENRFLSVLHSGRRTCQRKPALFRKKPRTLHQEKSSRGLATLENLHMLQKTAYRGMAGKDTNAIC
ncbi:uncharacterized protein LOC114054421 [Vombatus ursinus]|uniref:uncharacterized protein LOC114054421 n=1 Tax=Vombatus ursinus TaxID=29139 RepID=UPI000FFDB1C2|nr:uncharacterized protein LOC114054421 [Vombatus ursinus]